MNRGPRQATREVARCLAGLGVSSLYLIAAFYTYIVFAWEEGTTVGTAFGWTTAALVLGAVTAFIGVASDAPRRQRAALLSISLATGALAVTLVGVLL